LPSYDPRNTAYGVGWLGGMSHLLEGVINLSLVFFSSCSCSPRYLLVKKRVFLFLGVFFGYGMCLEKGVLPKEAYHEETISLDHQDW